MTRTHVRADRVCWQGPRSSAGRAPSMVSSFGDSLEAARRGDPEAFEALFAGTMPALMAFLRSRLDGVVAARESIRDLAQSVCREALTDLEKLAWRGPEAFRAWLFVLATRKLADRRRFHTQERRDARIEKPPADDASTILSGYASLTTPSREASAKEEIARVEDALQKLPDAQREALLLSRVAGLSYAEIARQKECDESAVRRLVARALARLALLLGEA